ncbi:WD repeat domain 92 [Strigomonas culicis]|uniref:WD repeat domain 92 n=1 Tax=Strigomonas culicis TaxID=28005 RepID=S9UGR8_9TRYP|nr:WD repeat domain 92 [Strigomonas culicis]EPY28098.1 WD repeat domain 92 [Strigomonas culicis]|eukprot:EPY26647.1 WD repeat domain 92 [Strigomonas culicis]
MTDADRRKVTSRQQIIQHVKKNVLYTPFDVKWVPHTNVLTSLGQYSNNHGALCLYRLRRAELVPVAELRLPHPVKCMTYGHNAGGSGAATVAVGDFVGGVALYDVERLGGLAPAGAAAPASFSYALTDAAPATVFAVPRAHGSIINAIDGARAAGPPELATCSRDGSVRVWDCRQAARPIVSLNPPAGAAARDSWAVALGNSHDPDERVVAAGYDNGDVKLFDLRTNKVLHEMNVGNGVCQLAFDRADIPMNKLIVSMLEGRVRCYDLRTRHPTLGYAYVEERVSEGTVWASAALPQNREIFMCGGGGELTLCRYQYPPERERKDADGVAMGVAGAIEELNRVKVGDQPINMLDWNRAKEGLLACAGLDQSLRVVLVTKLSLVS